MDRYTRYGKPVIVAADSLPHLTERAHRLTGTRSVGYLAPAGIRMDLEQLEDA